MISDGELGVARTWVTPLSCRIVGVTSIESKSFQIIKFFTGVALEKPNPNKFDCSQG